jgi:hypothetical protein
MSEIETPFDQEVVETPAKEETRTFTQDELEAQLGSRLAREREKFGDYNDLKAKAEQFDELQAANKTELEKLMERAESAERERDEVAKTATEQAVSSAIIAEASRRGVIDPDDVVALLDKSSLSVEGSSVTGVAEAVGSLLEAKPHLLANQTPGPVDSGPRETADGEKEDPMLAIGRNILASTRR